MRTLIAALLLSPVTAFAADNYAECILEKMPGVANNSAAYAALDLCKKRFPALLDGVERGSGRGFFARFESGAECALEVSRETPDRLASLEIYSACVQLYDEPNFFDQFDHLPK